MTTRECILKYLDKGLSRPEITKKVIKEIGAAKKTIDNTFAKLGVETTIDTSFRDKKKAKAKAKVKVKLGKDIPGAQTVEEFGKPFDYPGRVEEALDILRTSDKAVCPDKAFQKFCRISDIHWKNIKTLKRFEKYHRRLNNGSTIWGDPKELDQAEKRFHHIYA